MMDVKIGQDKKTRKPEPSIPEWVRNPCVQVGVIPGRRIVSHYRWTFSVVIIVDYFRLSVILRWFNRILSFIHFNWQALLSSKILERLDRLIPVDPQFPGIHCSSDGTLQFTNNIRRHWIISNPSVFRCDTNRSQHTLSFRLIFGLPYLEYLGQFDRKVSLTNQGLSDWRGASCCLPRFYSHHHLSRRSLRSG